MTSKTRKEASIQTEKESYRYDDLRGTPVNTKNKQIKFHKNIKNKERGKSKEPDGFEEKKTSSEFKIKHGRGNNSLFHNEPRPPLDERNIPRRDPSLRWTSNEIMRVIGTIEGHEIKKNYGFDEIQKAIQKLIELFPGEFQKDNLKNTIEGYLEKMSREATMKQKTIPQIYPQAPQNEFPSQENWIGGTWAKSEIISEEVSIPPSRSQLQDEIKEFKKTIDGFCCQIDHKICSGFKGLSQKVNGHDQKITEVQDQIKLLMELMIARNDIKKSVLSNVNLDLSSVESISGLTNEEIWTKEVKEIRKVVCGSIAPLFNKNEEPEEEESTKAQEEKKKLEQSLKKCQEEKEKNLNLIEKLKTRVLKAEREVDDAEKETRNETIKEFLEKLGLEPFHHNDAFVAEAVAYIKENYTRNLITKSEEVI